MDEDSGDIARLLQRARDGDTAAVGELYDLLYADLRRVAHNRLRHADFDGRLDTTSLVHESFIRLASLRRLTVDDRAHFFAYAARAMRSVVVDTAREAQSERRGGGNSPVTLTTSAHLLPEAGAEIIAVHEALQELAAIDERLVRVVELRYFVGLDVPATAEALGLSERTVARDWQKARSFLYVALRPA